MTLVTSGLELFTLLGHSSAVTALTFIKGSSGGDSFLTSGSEDGTLMFWDLNKRIRLKTFKAAHSRRISSLTSSHDGLTVVSIGWDGRCKIWSGKGHRELSELLIQDFANFNCVAYHPHKDSIITGNWKGEVQIWDLVSLKEEAKLEAGAAATVAHQSCSSIQDVQITLDTSKVVTVDIKGQVCVFAIGK